VDGSEEAAFLPLGDRFTVARRIGAGAFGAVYEAFDQKLGRRIAIKRLMRPQDDGLYRFKHEFRALAEVAHPNLVRLYELFAQDRQWWFTMELIDGVDFLAWVRGTSSLASAPTLDDAAPDAVAAAVAGELDDARLRAAACQLAVAVRALHRRSILHLDLKPPNVLVDRGRVVVLDFGLAVDIAQPPAPRRDDRISGTPAYMSPEQAAGQAPTMASDWYSFGVMLYEALTGCLPFAGSPAQIMVQKQFADGPDPARLAPGLLPADLCALAHALLRRDPKARPDGDEVLARLGVDDAPEVGRAAWVDREREAEALARALADVRTRARVVVIEGPSGIGKSAVVQRLADAARAQALLLVGRCFPQETVPHKTLDGVVDALAAALAALPHPEVEQLTPPGVRALARLFPVLDRVAAIADAPPVAGEPHQLRRTGFAALRALLAALGERAPIVLVVDDLQWGDGDGAIELIELLRPPSAPPILAIAIHRDGPASPALLALRDAAASAGVPVQPLSLTALPAADAQALAAALLGDGDGGARAAEIAREAAGVPLFIHELARYAGSAATVADVLDARLGALSEAARRLFEVLAVARRPLALPTALHAAAVDEAALDALTAAQMVRAVGDRVDCAHERLREAALQKLERAQLEMHHAALARALEAEPEVDAEAVALHLRAAGAVAAAKTWVGRAAEAARDQLAFEQAANLRRLALELADAAEARAARLALAEALADAGRSAEAGRFYLTLVDGAAPADALRLRRAAAVQLMRSGNIDEGLAVMRPVLSAVRLRHWSRPWLALGSLLISRARLRFERARPHVGVAAARPDELLRADVCWSMASGLSGIDVIRGVDYHARHTLLALRTGEPERIARALAWEAMGAALERGADRARAARLLDEADAAASRAGTAYARGSVAGARAADAWCGGRWRESITHADAALAALHAVPRDVAWEVGSLNSFFRLPAFLHLGELEALGRRARECLRHAEELGDRYTATTLRTNVMPVTWLIIDDADQAEREAVEAIRRWSTSPQWHIQHWCAFFGQAHVDLYRGEARQALARLRAAWPRVRRALILRIAPQRLQTLQLRAHCALATVEHDGHDGALLALAERDTRRIAREVGPWPAAVATHLGAGLAALRGEPMEAVRLLRSAESQYRALDMQLMLASVRWRLGELVGGDEGMALRTAGERFFTAQRVARPERWWRALVPGIAVR
jgi:hypothetical protein